MNGFDSLCTEVVQLLTDGSLCLVHQHLREVSIVVE